MTHKKPDMKTYEVTLNTTKGQLAYIWRAKNMDKAIAAVKKSAAKTHWLQPSDFISTSTKVV
jgi:L-rhamnose mutarotase